jgi:hypothetical protein
VAGFIADGLFTGQSEKFVDTLHEMAEAADAAARLL